jgi:hypothetical protein
VALVDDDEPVGRRQFGDVVSTGEGLQHGNINYSTGLGSTVAELTGLNAKELTESWVAKIWVRGRMSKFRSARLTTGNSRRATSIPPGW